MPSETLRTNFDGPTSAVLDAATNEFMACLSPCEQCKRYRAAMAAIDMQLESYIAFLEENGCEGVELKLARRLIAEVL